MPLRVLASPYRELGEMNPHPSLLYDAIESNGVRVSSFSGRKLLRGEGDVWHLHWPLERYFSTASPVRIFVGLCRFWLLLKIARLRKTKIVWTAHNLFPHDGKYEVLQKLFWHIFLPEVRAIICMSKSAEQLLFSEHPRCKLIAIYIIPHGHYRGAYPDTITKVAARGELNIHADQFVIAFVGRIRPYKGILELSRCFNNSKLFDCELLIAGIAENDLASKLLEVAAVNNFIKLYLDFINPENMQIYLRAADLVILPYREVLNSGSAILALSFDRPILVPAIGVLPELRDIAGSDWVMTYNGELTPKIIYEAVGWAKARKQGACERAPLEFLDWRRVAEQTIDVYNVARTENQHTEKSGGV